MMVLQAAAERTDTSLACSTHAAAGWMCRHLGGAAPTSKQHACPAHHNRRTSHTQPSSLVPPRLAGIDMEEQEAVLNRYMKEHDVKKMLKIQQEVSSDLVTDSGCRDTAARQCLLHAHAGCCTAQHPSHHRATGNTSRALPPGAAPSQHRACPGHDPCRRQQSATLTHPHHLTSCHPPAHSSSLPPHRLRTTSLR